MRQLSRRRQQVAFRGSLCGLLPLRQRYVSDAVATIRLEAVLTSDFAKKMFRPPDAFSPIAISFPDLHWPVKFVVRLGVIP